jgi:hypothetical protein
MRTTLNDNRPFPGSRCLGTGPALTFPIPTQVTFNEHEFGLRFVPGSHLEPRFYLPPVDSL